MQLLTTLRRSLRDPGHLVLTVVVMSLTVGASTLVAALVNAVWLRPRPIAEPERVVNLSRRPVHGTGLVDMLTSGDLQQLRQLAVFDGVAGQVSAGGLMGDYLPVLTLADGTPVEVLAVTDRYFEVLGVRIRGRGLRNSGSLLSDEDIVISDRLWRTAYRADPELLGRQIDTSLGRLVVSGIAPPGFHGARLGEMADAWIPFSLSVREGHLKDISVSDQLHALRAVPFVGLARLRPGVTLEHAQRLLETGGNGSLYCLCGRSMAAERRRQLSSASRDWCGCP